MHRLLAMEEAFGAPSTVEGEKRHDCAVSRPLLATRGRRRGTAAGGHSATHGQQIGWLLVVGRGRRWSSWFSLKRRTKHEGYESKEY